MSKITGIFFKLKFFGKKNWLKYFKATCNKIKNIYIDVLLCSNLKGAVENRSKLKNDFTML